MSSTPDVPLSSVSVRRATARASHCPSGSPTCRAPISLPRRRQLLEGEESVQRRRFEQCELPNVAPLHRKHQVALANHRSSDDGPSPDLNRTDAALGMLSRRAWIRAGRSDNRRHPQRLEVLSQGMSRPWVIDAGCLCRPRALGSQDPLGPTTGGRREQRRRRGVRRRVLRVAPQPPRRGQTIQTASTISGSASKSDTVTPCPGFR